MATAPKSLLYISYGRSVNDINRYTPKTERISTLKIEFGRKGIGYRSFLDDPYFYNPDPIDVDFFRPRSPINYDRNISANGSFAIPYYSKT